MKYREDLNLILIESGRPPQRIPNGVLASAAKTATSFGAIESSTPREAASRGVEPSIAPKDVAVFAALAETIFGMRCGGRPDKVKKYNKK